MRLELKALGYQPFGNNPELLARWEPEDPANFGAWFCAVIGRTGEDSWADFDGFVCSPRWLDEHDWDEVDGGRHRPATLWGHGLVMQRRWSYDDLRATIEDLCASAESEGYAGLAERMGRYLEWEHDYRHEEQQGIRNLKDEGQRRIRHLEQ